MLIQRDLEQSARQAALELPVVAILGPRQSGKTTFARSVFSEHMYISLEDYDNRAFALSDPRAFLAKYRGPRGIILDEIQHAPHLLSFIQTIVDQENSVGYFILTGSQNFLVNQSISQTLAGRIAILTLLPFSIHELKNAQFLAAEPEESVFKGGYPRIYTQIKNISAWYNDYLLTYVERDVRQIQNVTDLVTFQRFMRLCAGRIGQVINYTSLANDVGVSVNMIKGWFWILEASYVTFVLTPYFENFSKRIIKSPKLYFYDTGIACALLGLTTSDDINTHYLRGGLFENLIIADLMKQAYNTRKIPHLYFWKDSHGNEIDCLIDQATRLRSIEIKAGKTINDEYFKGLKSWQSLTNADPDESYVIYGGSEAQKRTVAHVIPWHEIGVFYNE